MTDRVELLVATVGSNPSELISKMNINSPAIIANQTDSWGCFEENNVKAVLTRSRGVGINRNIALNLVSEKFAMFLDDDMILYDNYEDTVLKAFNEHKGADVIIFNFDFVNESGEKRARIKESKKLHIYNALQYGICATAVKTNEIKKNNISFSTLFGGGCIYGCGEDSLFFLDAFRKHLNIYVCSQSIGMNVIRESSWFTGYNKKYFYDKGAWIACAFPKAKLIMKVYYLVRFLKISECSKKEMYQMLSAGIKSLKSLKDYRTFEREMDG